MATESLYETVIAFLKQGDTTNLKTSSYPKEHLDFKLKISFGMGTAAKIPWLAFTANDIQVSNGFYPVFLNYKEESTLVLSYGISETNEFETTWPESIVGDSETISEYFDKKVHRYGDSYVFKAYKVNKEKDSYFLTKDNGEVVSSEELDNDLRIILESYKKCFDSIETSHQSSEIGIGLFYMEKQLEDFIIQNWDKTPLSKDLELIIQDGELVSQQFSTEIGPIDILTKDKNTGDYVVIELKKNQTSDDTVGQILRYMGWVKEKFNNPSVRGIIISGEYNKRLDYATKLTPQISIYTYSIDFQLKNNTNNNL